ncbi:MULTISPECIES: KUP/HAK/KT family potassium transporter [unclassified Methanoregula]|uniref:KUP/HAK/KT family potassium transporter n=1 Tax=unclassified Methanoregula TaxID=2649730 RepID=UPI0009C45F55|nr:MULTISPECIES: KUP/HAK/KT family potassium transporter [unclassified Methanoregula]OPX63613.1 MAG: potassium transport protein Kup [Methanoregula sp. PtaB.Bin085]OPY36221.1 MAG: potassium transport protein Kup [Methanoregula sp. PtaU1.Bin006]
MPNDSLNGVIKSMGLVFGDIGTSPIYALTAIFLIVRPTPENVLGILSLILWTLTMLVTVQYTYLAMHLGTKGEGGTIVLREILLPLVKPGSQTAFVSLLAIVGIALFMGDAVITPAISMLSAVEGVAFIPGLEQTSQTTLMIIAGLIAIGLFSLQARGSERVAWTFGPVMVVWFAALAGAGLVAIFSAPEVIYAINPVYGIRYLTSHGIEGFLILSAVILVATGGEALYADMGHLGREPIIRAWHIVFVALAVNYLGQGAFILTHPGVHNILFEMILSEFGIAYIPFVLLSISATIIASQAMISGIFSIVYQGITTRMMPLLRIDYTSPLLRSQIYIDTVNWALLLAVLFIIVIFRTSNNLTHAYGLAVCGTMVITAIFVTWIFIRRGQAVRSMIAAAILGITASFLVASFDKIPYGGYWSLVIAAIPFSIILIYINGQKKLAAALQPVSFDSFIKQFNEAYASLNRISGTALFFARDFRNLPQYIPRIMFTNRIIYDDNIIVSITRTEQPFGITWGFTREVARGFSIFEIYAGYMEFVNIGDILKEAEIDELTIFYGMEDIVTNHVIWRIFAAVKRLSPSLVQFYKLPSDKIHGVVMRVEM